MNTQKLKYILVTLLVLLIGSILIFTSVQTPVQAAPDSPTYSYYLSPTSTTLSTYRVTLRITNLLGQTPPSSVWYGPDGSQVSPGCGGGQPIREYLYEYGSLYEVRDYFYISPCSRDLGRYTVEVGADYAGSFRIRTRIFLPLILTPPGPPGDFSKVYPADQAVGLQPLSLTLDWEDSHDADSYAYCYDTSDDDDCTNWVVTGVITQAVITDLSEDTTYFWQVRAANSLGTTYADDTYWSFTTGQAHTGTWTQMTAAAEWSERDGHTSVVLSDGSIVLMGGHDGDNRLNDVWRSTDQGATWEQMTAAAEWSARNVHASVVLSDDSILVMGGYDGSKLNDVWLSTDKGATWTEMTAAAEWSARSSFTSVALSDDSIVLMGGSLGITRLNDVWRSTNQGANWTQMTAAAEWSGRMNHTSVALSDDSIVLMGGWTSSSPYYANDVWRSTDLGATWIQMTAAAGWAARYDHTSTVLPDDSIFLMGGRSDYSDAWLSPDMGAAWTEVTPTPPWSARYDASSVTLTDGSVLLIGGSLGLNNLNDVWRFVPGE